MLTIRRFFASLPTLLTVGAALAAVGCDADSGGSQGTGSGTVTDPWTSYCVATFTEDHAVMDTFGDPLFTAKAGEQYLVAGESMGGLELFYLTPNGGEKFEVDPAAVTSSCEGATQAYIAALADVTVFADEALTTELCQLTAGTALPSDGGHSGYYSIVGDITFSGPSTYEVFLNAFSAQCGDADVGYVSVPETAVLGTHTWLVPIQQIIGPA